MDCFSELFNMSFLALAQYASIIAVNVCVYTENKNKASFHTVKGFNSPFYHNQNKSLLAYQADTCPEPTSTAWRTRHFSASWLTSAAKAATSCCFFGFIPRLAILCQPLLSLSAASDIGIPALPICPVDPPPAAVFAAGFV